MAILGCGVYLIKDNTLLLGKRTDGQGWAIPGGKVEQNEVAAVAAEREFLEETGASCTIQRYLGTIHTEAVVHGKVQPVNSALYLSQDFKGTILDSEELVELQFFSPTQLRHKIENGEMFRPTKDGLTAIPYLIDFVAQ